jgi:hypothetical protein
MGKTVNTAYLIAGENCKEDDAGQVPEIERTYRVITAFGDTAAAALAATSLPKNGDAHPTYSKLKVTSREPVMQDNGIEWLITVTYTANTVASQSQGYKLVRLEYGTHQIQEDVMVNRGTGQPLLDANKKPFESMIQEAVDYPYIRIIKKQKTVSRADVLTKSGSINEGVVTVAGVQIQPHNAKIKITATEQESLDYPWEITYEVMIKTWQLYNYVDFAGVLQPGPLEAGWDIAYLNRGFYYYVPGGQNCRAMENIVDGSGTVIEQKPSATPLLLALDGQLLGEGLTPISILVQTIKDESWATLGLNKL